MTIGRCLLSVVIVIGYVLVCVDETDADGIKPDVSNGNGKQFPFYVVPICKKPPYIECRYRRYRSADGTCNNLRQPRWGSTNMPYKRLLPAIYEDVTSYHSTPRLLDINGRPLSSPRTISNYVHTSKGSQIPLKRFSNAHQAFGQFFDHDMNSTPVQDEPEGGCCKIYNPLKIYEQQKSPCWGIPITKRDDVFPERDCMEFVRSKPSAICHSNPGHPAAWEQKNIATSWIDASQVYGTSGKKQNELRTRQQGRMRVKGDNLLPVGDNALCLERLDNNTEFYCMKAGDDRSNEHPSLSSFHIIFVRLHNEICDKLARLNRRWNDERLFQEARKIIGAILQIIIYKEWLPGLLGNSIIRQYQLEYSQTNFQYNPDTDPTILNEFSTAAFRYGHSEVPNEYTVGNRKIALNEMYHDPSYLERNNGSGIDLFASGMLKDSVMACDRFFSDALVNKMFEVPGKIPSLDLAALNIQRGRDHGLQGYNAYRKFLGSPPITYYGPKAAENRRILQHVYDNLDDVDLYTGSLMEDPLPGAMVGPTFAAIIADTFHRIKFGDRFWWQSQGFFTRAQQEELRQVTIAKVLCETTHLENGETQTRGFENRSYWNPVQKCYTLLKPFSSAASGWTVAGIDLRTWIR